MRHTKRAFTLIELLVVVAIIGLLISILLPALSAAREQAKRGKCLSNIKNISSSATAYAFEDEKELIVPIHQGTFHAGIQPGGQYQYRIGIPFAWAGRTPSEPIATITGFTDPNGPWAARTRPLNNYLLTAGVTEADSSRGALELFRCPSDTGYPDRPEWVTTNYIGHPDVRQKALWDVIGNSYRSNSIGVIFGGGVGSTPGGSFTSGPWGQTLSRLNNTGRVVLFAEPLFYVMTIPDLNQNADLSPLVGFHKQVMTENVSFVDGSARTLEVQRISDWSQEDLSAMNYYGLNGSAISIDNPLGSLFLRRGEAWQTDAYPSPGALIRGRRANGEPNDAIQNTIAGYRGWPFSGYSDNLRD